jgi:hypothetical protein
MPAFFFGGWRNHSSLDGEQLKKGARHGSMVVDGWLHSCICMRDRYSVLTVGYGHLACCCHHCLRMLVVSPGSFPAFLFLIISSLTSSILDLKPCKIYIYIMTTFILMDGGEVAINRELKVHGDV